MIQNIEVEWAWARAQSQKFLYSVGEKYQNLDSLIFHGYVNLTKPKLRPNYAEQAFPDASHPLTMGSTNSFFWILGFLTR